MTLFQRPRFFLRILLTALCIGVSICVAEAGTIVRVKINPEDYAEVLRSYVNDEGMVDYRALKSHREKLDAFTDALADIPVSTYDNWTHEQTVAFWINAYNALTLKSIIDNYPIKASFFKSRLYPRNSIRQIPGVWNKMRFAVMHKEVTLDEIEHTILRSDLKEPRIHVALVCAAIGCPPLRNEPYVGAKLNDQLDDQARRFLTNPNKFRIDRESGIVYLSSIFNWFGDDFMKGYGTDKDFSGHTRAERAVLGYISKYIGEDEKQYLLNADYDIQYLDYDWSLNEQSEK